MADVTQRKSLLPEYFRWAIADGVMLLPSDFRWMSSPQLLVIFVGCPAHNY